MACRGMIGKQVVVRKGGDGGHVVSAAPHRANVELSEAQKANLERFRQAIAYSRGAKSQPEYAQAAEARGMSTHNVVVADFLRPPEITKVDISGYHGEVGQPIVITAIDDVKVKAVVVLIAADDGRLVEKGAAVQAATDATHWTYTATAKAAANAVKIVADAADLADHVTAFGEEVQLAQ